MRDIPVILSQLFVKRSITKLMQTKQTTIATHYIKKSRISWFLVHRKMINYWTPFSNLLHLQQTIISTLFPCRLVKLDSNTLHKQAM